MNWNDDEIKLELAPKGWIVLIKGYVKDRDYESALDTLDAFDNWLDAHLVPSKGKKKGKKKK